MNIHVTAAKFKEWCATKDGYYQTADNCNCPMANFAKEVYGFQYPRANWKSVYDANYKNIYFSFDIFPIISRHRTFKKLAEDL